MLHLYYTICTIRAEYWKEKIPESAPPSKLTEATATNGVLQNTTMTGTSSYLFSRIIVWALVAKRLPDTPWPTPGMRAVAAQDPIHLVTSRYPSLFLRPYSSIQRTYLGRHHVCLARVTREDVAPTFCDKLSY